MPVQITKPVYKSLGIVKDTIGSIVGVQWAEKTTFTENVSADGHTTWIPSKMPELIFVKVFDKPNLQQNDLPPGVTAIAPQKCKVKVELSSGVKTLQIPAVQFPLVAAYSLVIDKMQGITLDSIIIADLNSTRSTPPTVLYTALTRATSLEGVYFLEPMTRATLTRFTPKPFLYDEIDRLLLLPSPPSLT